MYIKSLSLRAFRNYTAATVLPTQGLNVFYGKNAQGKTNLLEAVFLCCLGRSHRTPREKEMILDGEESAAVELKCVKTNVGRTIRYNLLRSEKHRILLDGVNVTRIGELMGQLNVVLFAPEHLTIVKDGPQERRRFLDMELSQTYPSYFFTLQQYQKVLRQRNNLLKAVRFNEQLIMTLPDWDAQLARLGAYLMAERAAFTQKLGALARENHKDISGGSELLSVEYAPNLPALDEKTMLGALTQSRETDLKMRTTTVGPHRDDLALLLNGRDLRVYGSQGQARTAALALKLSELSLIREETGEWPVLMLDDVMSELDQSRRRYLMERILPVQTLITATELGSDWPASQGFLVENGTVKPV